MLKNKILSAISEEETIYSDDVFSAYLRTGTGTDITINTGIDMTNGYMLWSKSRSANADHAIYDSVRGVTLDLVSNSTIAQTTQSTGLKAVSSTGYTVGSLAKMNTSGNSYIDYIFRKSRKFFEPRTFNHTTGTPSTINLPDLGTIGMVMCKTTNTTGDWLVWHLSLTTGNNLRLNSTIPQNPTNAWLSVSGTTVTLAASAPTASYVLYAWAHDSSVSGIIKCGLMSFFSSTVYSDQSVTIPTGVTLLTITGRGGNGTATMTDPGQPYIAPFLEWYLYMPYNPSTGNVFSTDVSGNSLPTPSYVNQQQSIWVYCVYRSETNDYFCPFDIYRVRQNPGQPYIAPTYEYTTGQTSTVNIAGQTFNFPGGYGGAASTYTYTIELSGATSQNMVLTNFYAGAQLTYSYTIENSASSATIGWEPQFVLCKDASSTADWKIVDSLRGFSADRINSVIKPNSFVAESTETFLAPNATGVSTVVSSPQDIIYVAIRRLNKPSTSGAQVYNSVTRTGSGTVPWKASGAGFVPDMSIMSWRSNPDAAYQHSIIDRLRRATEHIQTVNIFAEGGGWGAGHIHNMDGYDGLYSTDYNYYNMLSTTYVDHHFKREHGFFDIVCDQGTGFAHSIPHSLGAVPELMIRKSRSVSGEWDVYCSALANSEKLVLNSNIAKVTAATTWNSTSPTSTVFTVGTDANVNSNYYKYVTYLFATLPGISKVGNYVGNGTTQEINCGFTTGARFFLVKATSTTGNWWIYDSARGIASASDPALALNSTAAEITTVDAVDPYTSGIIVNQEATCSINASGTSYIFLAIA